MLATGMTETFARSVVVYVVGEQRPLSQARAEMQASKIQGAGVSGSARRRMTLNELACGYWYRGLIVVMLR